MSWENPPADPEALFRVRPPDALMREAFERSAALGLGVPSLEIGRMLEILAGERSVRRVLEIGRGVGFSTLCLARGAAQAEVLSLDPIDDFRAEAAALLEQAGVEDRVVLSTGDPLLAIEAIEGYFDLIHLSVAIAETLRLVDRVLPKLAVGGVLTVEGLRPTEEPSIDRARAVAGYLVIHPQLDTEVLALGEGLGVARKKKPLVTEMGGPY